MAPKPWFLVRADASIDIGSGHIMRCLTLANALQKKGMEGVFLSISLPKNMESLILQCGLSVEVISVGGVGSGLALYKHSHWLPHAEISDISAVEQRLVGLSKKFGRRPSLIVVDHYALALPWERQLGQVAPVLVIDDLNDRPHAGKWLLDQTAGKSSDSYDHLLEYPGTHKFIGSQFALLRDEFYKRRPKALSRRKGLQKVQRILVTLGGVDKENITSLVLECLACAALPDDIHVEVIAGGVNPHIASLERLVDSLPYFCTLDVQVNDMADRMVLADLCIGAAGATSWERCALGLPTINLVLADNQAQISESLQQLGASLDFGKFTKHRGSEFSSLMQKLIQSPLMVREMAANAFNICDGLGAERVASVVYDEL